MTFGSGDDLRLSPVRPPLAMVVHSVKTLVLSLPGAALFAAVSLSLRDRGDAARAGLGIQLRERGGQSAHRRS